MHRDCDVDALASDSGCSPMLPQIGPSVPDYFSREDGVARVAEIHARLLRYECIQLLLIYRYGGCG